MDPSAPDAVTSFRQLHELLMEYEGPSPFEDVLRPAIPAARALMEPLRRYRSRQAVQTPVDEELWSFFALSVVNDVLRLPLAVTQREYLHFFEALGFEPFERGDFSPVRHEIVKVGNWPRVEEGIALGRTYWPGLMFGELVFSRSAVDVLCHPSFGIHAAVVNGGTLYFTQDRMGRETHSLAHGWGSNSRWRTPFRLDYEEREHVVFNALGRMDLADPTCLEHEEGGQQGLPIEARRELLMHRCFVSYAKGHTEDWSPYRDTLAVRRSGPPWPLDEAQLLRVDEPGAVRR